MKEVQRLIYEGPIIQQTAAGLPQLLNYDGHDNLLVENSISIAPPQNTTQEPADKRQKRSSLSGAEDAEALVGFLRSVRASAAAGQP